MKKGILFLSMFAWLWVGMACSSDEEVLTPIEEPSEPEEPGDPAHYDVEFYQGDLEYDYEIHAVTGEILSWEKDK